MKRYTTFVYGNNFASSRVDPCGEWVKWEDYERNIDALDKAVDRLIKRIKSDAEVIKSLEESLSWNNEKLDDLRRIMPISREKVDWSKKYRRLMMELERVIESKKPNPDLKCNCKEHVERHSYWWICPVHGYKKR